MQTILTEIVKLRNDAPIVPERNNKNKYCIISNDDNYKTAYCFGVPIYNSKSNKLLDLQFREKDNLWYYHGSTAEISINDVINFTNGDGTFAIDLLDGNCVRASKRSICYRQTELRPTANGVLIRKECSGDSSVQIKFSSSTPFTPYWVNDRCFCFMKADFQPFISVSCIGASIDSRNISNPIKIGYTKANDYEFVLEFINTNPLAKYLYFEVNMYEKKLFQDTTVESAAPTINNVYGTTAYIGTTALMGEQWLYTKIDYSLIAEFHNRKIERVVIHLPKINHCSTDLEVHKVSSRFCSFGSTWDNKISPASPNYNIQQRNGYYSIDITNQTIDSFTKYMKTADGFIIKPKFKNNGFAVVSTGDSSFAPPILEICYR